MLTNNLLNYNINIWFDTIFVVQYGVYKKRWLFVIPNICFISYMIHKYIKNIRASIVSFAARKINVILISKYVFITNYALELMKFIS